MPNSILPFRTGGGPSFPLSPDPHFSRVEDQISTDDIIGSHPKNYQSVAFRPGFPLQGSELNEIQEHFQLQLTLTIAMMNNWITSGAGPMWGHGAGNYPGDGSLPSTSPVSTGIGVGGQNAQNGGHVQEWAISGPGWRGATPLHPFVSPYSGGVTDNQVEVEYLAQNKNLKITFNPGWWCVELPQKNPSTNDFQYISGLKHWIYIDESIQVLPTIPVGMGNPLDIEIPVGLVMQTLYYDCFCTDEPLEYCDPDLGDNSGNFTNDVGCGASRYAINAIGGGTVSNVNWPTSSETSWPANGREQYDKLSLVCKINPLRRTVRYMNNIILFTW